MDRLIIEPGTGIGQIRLGMTKTEVEEWLRSYTDRYEITREQNPQRYHLEGTIRSCFQCEFDEEGKVSVIQISSGLKDVLHCEFMGIDVFRMKAEELVAQIDQLSPYDREHGELGYTYEFPALGLTFWRPVILNEADLAAEWFQEMDPAIQEDEMKNLYFECVSVRRV